VSSSVAELLAELVAMPTQQAGGEGGAGDELALCERIAPMLSARGAEQVVVERAPRSDGTPGAYVFARWGTPKRLINAHVDTVPANVGWTRSPWQVHVDHAAGKLYGLGACDTKSAIAATLVALESERPRELGVLFSGDEEAGSAVMHAFLASPHARDIRDAIVCEPTARTAGIAHRGVLAQALGYEGAGGHSSKADYMPRPIAELARVAVGLDDLGRARLHDGPPGMQGLCLNLASFHGGVAFNVVPQRAKLEWSLRPYPGFDRAAWDRAVAQLVSSHAVDTTIDHPPFRCEHPDALVELVKPFTSSIGALDFWTEAALLAAHGIDAIVVGPGDISRAHAPDEWVALDDLDWAIELLRAAMR
jgi:acetylornithine deacetylase